MVTPEFVAHRAIARKIGMDASQQEQTYRSFIGLSKWLTIATAVILFIIVVKFIA